MPTFAAIDIGANSVRLKIARLVRHRLRVVHEDREVTRLGESVFRSGLLAPDAMAKSIKVLQRFHKAAQKMGASVVRVVATSALRDARNRRAFLDWVHATTGWKLEVITGLEEGRLIHLGILTNRSLRMSPVLLIDLGGGSCELTISDHGHIRYTASLSLGAVRLTQEFLQRDPPSRKELQRLETYVAEELDRVAERIAGLGPRGAIATSGTAAALSAVCGALAGNSGGDWRLVRRAAAVKMASRLARLSLAERARFPGIGPRRAEIIVAGATVFAQLVERCGLAGFRYSSLGLRDGLLAQMAAEYDQRTRSRRQVESDRWDALLDSGKHFGVNLTHARQVRRLTLRLFEELKGVHTLPAEYGEWLSAAAMLHEVGAYVNRNGWHRHAHYVIANTEILGYTVYERRLIAAIARYLGNSRPEPSDKAIKLLRAADRELVPKAVALLRLGLALNQSRNGAVKEVRGRVREGNVQLFLRPARGKSVELELWTLAKERGYFREVLGRELEAAAS